VSLLCLLAILIETEPCLLAELLLDPPAHPAKVDRLNLAKVPFEPQPDAWFGERLDMKTYTRTLQHQFSEHCMSIS
jgi:hypothetical protein